MPWPKGQNGPGLGAGWCGPAKGAGALPAKAYTADSETRRSITVADNFNPTEQLYRQDRQKLSRDRRALKLQRTINLEDRLYQIAMGEFEASAVAVQANARLHAIWNGQPVATNVNLTSDDIPSLTDDELREELERTSGTTITVTAGTESPDLQD